MWGFLKILALSGWVGAAALAALASPPLPTPTPAPTFPACRSEATASCVHAPHADDPVPFPICRNPVLEPIPDPTLAFEIERTRECFASLQNCACSILGTGSCENMFTVGDATYRQNPRTYADRRRRSPRSPTARPTVNPQSGEVVLDLNQTAVDGVVHSVDWNRHRSVEAIKFEYNRWLSEFVSGMSMLNLARDIEAPVRMGRTHIEGAGIDRLAVLSTEVRLRGIWRRLGPALRSCRAMQAALSPDYSPDDPEAVRELRDALTCALRMEEDLPFYRVMSRWPGCRCGLAGGRTYGRMVGEVCVGNWVTSSAFEDDPIDERMPGAISTFIRGLQARWPGMRIKRIGLLGCGFLRFETGGNVKGELPKTRELGMTHVSAHAKSTACDLDSITFLDSSCSERTFRMALRQNGEKTLPFFSALQKYTVDLAGVTGVRWPVSSAKNKKLKLNGPGIGEFYRDLESRVASLERPPMCPAGARACTPGSPILSDEEWFQLKAGVLARNQLVDSGLIVYDPCTNSAHHDHLHFTLPADDMTWKQLQCTGRDCTAQYREDLIRERMLRAAGILK